MELNLKSPIENTTAFYLHHNSLRGTESMRLFGKGKMLSPAQSTMPHWNFSLHARANRARPRLPSLLIAADDSISKLQI